MISFTWLLLLPPPISTLPYSYKPVVKPLPVVSPGYHCRLFGGTNLVAHCETPDHSETTCPQYSFEAQLFFCLSAINF